MTATSPAEAIALILSDWDQDADDRGLGLDQTAALVADVLQSLPNVAKTVVTHATMGSAYIDVILAEADEDGDERWETVRVSNHKQKSHHERVFWSFEADHKASLHQVGLDKIAAL